MANKYWIKIKNLNKQNKTWFWGGIGGVIFSLIVTVSMTIYSNSGKQNPSPIKNNTKNTFNDLKTISGDININIGNGNINKTVNNNSTIVQGIPHKQYFNLAKELGVTENAVKNFFKIIQHKEVPKEDWETTLRQIAVRHKELQSRLKKFNLLVDPEIQKLRLKAEQAINKGDYDSADKYLDNALERQMLCINNAEKQLNNCKLSAAEMKVDKGDLELIRINYRAATKLFKEAVELLPNGHELIKAVYLLKWGDAAYDAGLYTESQTALEKCLAIKQKLLPKDDLYLANILNNLAGLYRSQGKYEEAEPLHKRCLEITEKTLGKDHPIVATSLNNFALLYEAQGKYAEAEPLYQRAIEIGKKSLGTDHPDLAVWFENLAGLYKSQGKYAEAESLYQKSLRIKEKALGKDHPSVATTLNDLALLYNSQGKYAEAEPLYQKSLKIEEKALGKDHPSVATTLNNLAKLYNSQEKYAEAEPLYQRAIEIGKKSLGTDHPDLALFFNNLAGLNRSQRKYAEAEPLYRRSLRIKEKALGKDHPSVATTLNDLALLYKSQSG